MRTEGHGGEERTLGGGRAAGRDYIGQIDEGEAGKVGAGEKQSQVEAKVNLSSENKSDRRRGGGGAAE